MDIAAEGKKSGAIASMNVVPLIDILMVLLVIFMLITPLSSRGLEALIPQPTRQAEPDAHHEVIIVQVMRNNQLKINEVAATWDNLGPQLNDIFKLRAEKVAFVNGDTTITFADVARAIGVMRSSGVEKVGLMTARIESVQ
jgi:biopolymer transport protein TolR